MLKPAQQGQQVHFSHTNLQNLIQHFVDWRIKLFTRTSSLCSGPRCGKQIFLSCAELGSVPPSFYIPRKKKLKKKGKKKKTPKIKKPKPWKGKKRGLFKWNIGPNHKSVKVQCKISAGPLLRQTLIHCSSSAGI